MKMTPLMQCVLIYTLGLLLGLFLIAIDPSCKYSTPDTETPMTIPIECIDKGNNDHTG